MQQRTDGQQRCHNFNEIGIPQQRVGTMNQYLMLNIYVVQGGLGQIQLILFGNIKKKAYAILV